MCGYSIALKERHHLGELLAACGLGGIDLNEFADNL
jgi:hypothetical protein